MCACLLRVESTKKQFRKVLKKNEFPTEFVGNIHSKSEEWSESMLHSGSVHSVTV